MPRWSTSTKSGTVEVPDEALVDGGFAKKEDIERVERGGTTVYAPVQKSKDPERDAQYFLVPTTLQPLAQWRQRMATDEAKAIYRERAATAECVNALARNRGLQRFGPRPAKSESRGFVVCVGP